MVRGLLVVHYDEKIKNISVQEARTKIPIYIYVSPKMRTVPVRELGSQFAN